MKSYQLKTFILAWIAIFLPAYLKAQIPSEIADNVPIALYGKVVDQNNDPVPEAKISFVVGILHSAVYGGEQKAMNLTADQNGKFILTGVVGHSIDKILIEKEGYELSQKARRGFVYTYAPDYNPDPANPVIFKMWKRQGKEPLVGSAWHGKVACDGTARRFDLSSGHPNPDGNLEIICSRTPVNLPPANIKPFTYKFRITIIGGGIQATDDEFTYLAPEDHYSSTLTFGQTADDPKWDRKTPIPEDYYIKTADGHYGRLSVKWSLAFAQSPTHLEWGCSINPSGSRNLER